MLRARNRRCFSIYDAFSMLSRLLHIYASPRFLSFSASSPVFYLRKIANCSKYPGALRAGQPGYPEASYPRTPPPLSFRDRRRPVRHLARSLHHRKIHAKSAEVATPLSHLAPCSLRFSARYVTSLRRISADQVTSKYSASTSPRRRSSDESNDR